MATAVLLLLTDEGQMLVGEIEPDMAPTEELQPVDTFEDAVQAAETLLLGEAPPESVEEDAFNESVNRGGSDMMGEEED
jgi:hypothetical protein